jgi:diguanylate cyclase (GGDEF)-like protein
MNRDWNRPTRSCFTSGTLSLPPIVWAFVVALLLGLHGLAQPAMAAQTSAPAKAPLQARAADAFVRAHVEMLVDATGTLTLDEVKTKAQAGAFAPAPPRLREAGDDERAHWLRITITQQGEQGDWALALRTTAIRDVRFHGPFDNAGRALAPTVLTGLNQPWSSRPLQSERYAFRLRLAEPGTYTAYLRLQSQTSQPYTLALYDLPQHLAERQDKRLFDGITYGLLLALLVYNLGLAASLRDRTYAWFVATCAAALLTLVSFNGHGARYLFPDWPAMAVAANVVFPSLWMVAAGGFGRSFLALRRHAPVFDAAALTLMALAALGAVLGALGEIGLAHRLVEVTSVGGILLMIGAACQRRLQGDRPAVWYLLGQSVMLVSVGSVVLINWGVLASEFVLANGLQLGVSAELVIFAMALSHRIRDLRERQEHLEATAAVLEHQAQTDPLTGLLNRSGLAVRAGAMLGQPGDRALLMIDLDHFKPVNDEHGHAFGDQVLIEIARRLGSVVREGDIVARLGGDEFVVVLASAPSLPMLEQRAAKLQAVLRKPVELPQGRAVIDSSIGVALAPRDGRTLEQLIDAADRAMYEAKGSGRGRYVFSQNPQGAATAAPPHFVSKV